MYKILEIEDQIRVPPMKFNLPAQEAVKKSLEEKWEGLVDKGLGVVLAVLSVDSIGEGKILPGDGAIHYKCIFKLMAYQPELHEVVRGEVIDITEFGAFVRFGPVDGMIHVSQVMNDYVSYDAKGSALLGRDSKRRLKESDIVVSRIVSVSMEKDQYKVGLTARQAGLGALEWVEEDKKRVKKAPVEVKKEAKPAGKDKKPAGKGGKK